MCYVCGPALVVEQPGFKIVYTRVADTFTQVEDFEFSADQVAAFTVGEWVYVGLCATLMVDNRPAVSQTVYGVRETPQDPCAFANELASAWVTEKVLGEYSPRSEVAVVE